MAFHDHAATAATAAAVHYCCSLLLYFSLSVTRLLTTSHCVAIERLVRGIERENAGVQSDVLQLRQQVRSSLRGRPAYVGVERVDKVSEGVV